MMIVPYTVLLIIAAATQVSCWSPTNSYAPGNVSCPDVESLVRPAEGLSASESHWVKQRHEVTDANLIKFLKHSKLEEFDAEYYINSMISSISIGVAFSGGGYRAMFAGAGQLAALDNRTKGAWEHGLGGLIESTSFLSGLSGGNWLLGTVAYNNWTSVESIINNGTIWDLQNSILSPGGLDINKTDLFWDKIFEELDDKKRAGFDISLTDPWGRALASDFFPTSFEDGSALTVSTLRDAKVFKNHQMPLPIHVSVGRTPGSFVIDSNSTIFEFTPFELGSWDPSLYAFTDIKYLGTNVSNGVPTSDVCISGFDNAGFIMGTSSSLFNSVTADANTTSLAIELLLFIDGLGYSITDQHYDIGLYHPNPFHNTSYTNVKSIVKADTLYLADGGEDDQNVPLAPLIQPEREVDVIFAFDNSADVNNWPNGTSLAHTYDRQFSKQGNNTVFPYVPPPEVFIKSNFTHKPVFFGCDSKNLTSLSDDGSIPPLVVYIANTNMTFASNTSTSKLSYTDEEKRGMVKNGFETTSRMNMTMDSDWRSCVSCAIIRRSQEKLGINQSNQCKKCFKDYCWNGSLK